MKNELDPAKILHAYEVVMEHGTPTEHGKIYEGIEAFADYDGCSASPEMSIDAYKNEHI